MDTHCTVKWVDQASFVGESGSGHAMVMDGAADIGGRDIGIRPMEMLLLGLGGCSAIDVVSILKKSRQRFTRCAVEISAARAAKPPRVFTRIHLHYVLQGAALSPDKVGRAIQLSVEKYCSASRMLAQSATLSHDFEIIEGD